MHAQFLTTALTLSSQFTEDSLHVKYDKFLSRLSKLAEGKWVSLDPSPFAFFHDPPLQ